jgi:hypothetical protein
MSVINTPMSNQFIDNNAQNIDEPHINEQNINESELSYANLKAAYDILQADYTVLQMELREKNNMVQNLYNDIDDMRDECDEAKDLVHKNEALEKESDNLNSELREYKKTNKTLVETNKRHENYINSCYKLKSPMTVSTADNNTIDISEGSNNTNNSEDVTRYELIPNDIVVNWLIDYINNACTFSSMDKHNLIYDYTHSSGEERTTKRPFKNNKWTLRIMLKQFFSYYHPQYCKRIYASKDIQNSQCMICYSDVVNPCILTCDCKYIYCYECINKWINKQKNNCPCCSAKTTLIEAGPLTPIHLKMIIDRQQSLSSIPQHLKILD